MPNSRERSAYEEGLSRCHRAAYWAQQRADAIGDDGAVEDLLAIQRHLAVMMEDSLRGRRRPRAQQQLSLGDRA